MLVASLISSKARSFAKAKTHLNVDNGFHVCRHELFGSKIMNVAGYLNVMRACTASEQFNRTKNSGLSLVHLLHFQIWNMHLYKIVRCR